MRRVFDKSRYVNVGGCWYRRDYRFIAYPFHSFPSGGVFNKLPDYYQDYEEELRKMREKRRQARDKEEQDRWRGKYKRFGQGFFGFNEEQVERSTDDNYPYSVFGLSRSASDEDMKKAYRKSVLKAHPDRGGSCAAFRKVREAWEYFKNII